MKNINLEKLLLTIKNRNLMNEWGEGLFTTTDEQRAERAEKVKAGAISSFEKMMRSSKNNGKDTYETWAINKALGLTTGTSAKSKNHINL